jgi:hypothetical protein
LTDTDNVFLVLTARQMAPHLAIIARAGFEDSKKKLGFRQSRYIL